MSDDERTWVTHWTQDSPPGSMWPGGQPPRLSIEHHYPSMYPSMLYVAVTEQCEKSQLKRDGVARERLEALVGKWKRDLARPCCDLRDRGCREGCPGKVRKA